MLQSSSGLLDTGVHTLQTTLVLKKRSEVDAVDTRLMDTRQEVQRSMKILQQRRAQLQQRQTEVREILTSIIMALHIILYVPSLYFSTVGFSRQKGL